MSEIASHISTEQSSEKSFGIVFSILFLIVTLYPLINSEDLCIWALVASIIFFFLAFIAPKVLVFPNKLWFQGRMEFEPRSLGNRSILGDPRSEKMQKILNLKVKYCESFRPFAP